MRKGGLASKYSTLFVAATVFAADAAVFLLFGLYSAAAVSRVGVVWRVAGEGGAEELGVRVGVADGWAGRGAGGDDSEDNTGGAESAELEVALDSSRLIWLASSSRDLEGRRRRRRRRRRKRRRSSYFFFFCQVLADSGSPHTCNPEMWRFIYYKKYIPTLKILRARTT